MRRFYADFETCDNKQCARVWLACVLDEEGNAEYFTDISQFIQWILFQRESLDIYFHNLKFDGSFIVDYLMRNGYTQETDGTIKNPSMFTHWKCFIADNGAWYSVTIGLRSRKRCKIMDSLKKIPLSVAEIAKAYKLKTLKGLIDYKAYRPEGYIATEDEKAYIYNDCDIVRQAMEFHFGEGMKKMTIGSDALSMYYKILKTKEIFRKYFPCQDEIIAERPAEIIHDKQVQITYDMFARRCYKGAWCYVNPKYEGKIVGEGSVYDVNSLYPSVMYYYPYPTGKGKYGTGEPPFTEYKLYLLHIRIEYLIKKDKFPCIQRKKSYFHLGTWATESEGYEEQWIVSPELDLIKDCYFCDIEYIEYIEYGEIQGLFKSYIDTFMEMKATATIEKNAGKRQIAKYYLNNLYGKFAQSPESYYKVPCINEKGDITFEIEEGQSRESIYCPVGAFITAYARITEITAAINNYDRFLYGDTDSIHILGYEKANGIEIDDVKLGAWKPESKFIKGKFLRQKTYAELEEDGLHFTCAGLKKDYIVNGERVSRNEYLSSIGITLETFEIGLTIPEGRLHYKRINGGATLEPSPFQLL